MVDKDASRTVGGLGWLVGWLVDGPVQASHQRAFSPPQHRCRVCVSSFGRQGVPRGSHGKVHGTVSVASLLLTYLDGFLFFLFLLSWSVSVIFMNRNEVLGWHTLFSLSSLPYNVVRSLLPIDVYTGCPVATHMFHQLWRVRIPKTMCSQNCSHIEMMRQNDAHMVITGLFVNGLVSLLLLLLPLPFLGCVFSFPPPPCPPPFPISPWPCSDPFSQTRYGTCP